MVAYSRLNQRLHKALDKQIQVLYQLSENQNIVTLHNVFRTENNIYLVFQYCPGGDLHRYLKQKSFRLKEEDAQNVIHQLAKALYALRQIKIVHRDLKLSNILLTNKLNIKESKIKLADFGLAREYQSDKMIKTHCGTPINMAPQILQGQPYTDKADLWSLGTIIYELVFGETPYTGRTQVQLLRNIQTKPLRFHPFLQLSKLIEDLIQKLLCIDPSSRISWQDLFMHKFVATDPLIFRQQLENYMKMRQNMDREKTKKKIEEEESQAKKKTQNKKENKEELKTRKTQTKLQQQEQLQQKQSQSSESNKQQPDSNNFLRVKQSPQCKNNQPSDSSTNIKYYDSQLDDNTNSQQFTGYDQGDSSSFSSNQLYLRKKQRHYSEKKAIESPPQSSRKQTLPQISQGSKEDGTSSKGSCIQSKLNSLQKRQDQITQKVISTLQDALQRSLAVIQMYESQFCFTHAYSDHRNSGKYIVYKCCYELMNTLQSIFAGESNLEQLFKNKSGNLTLQKRNLLKIFQSESDNQIEIDLKIIMKLRQNQKYAKLDAKLKEAFISLYNKVQEFRTDLYPIIERSYTNFRDRILDYQGNVINHANITRDRMRDVMKFVVKLCQDSQHQKYLQNWEESIEKLKRSKIVLSFLKIDYYQRDAFQTEVIKGSKTTKSYVSSSDGRYFERKHGQYDVNKKGEAHADGSGGGQSIRGKLYKEKDMKIIKCLQDSINMRMLEIQNQIDKKQVK